MGKQPLLYIVRGRCSLSTAICPGSFDPVTVGHLDIITRASHMFDEVIVLVSENYAKTYLFSQNERMELIKRVTCDLPNIRIEKDNGLLAEYAKKVNAQVIVKGLRAVSDFEYEFQMALTNKQLNPELETVFLITSLHNMFISSGIVKEVSSLGGDISDFVPEVILEDIVQRVFEKKNIV
jgi:pantetheine-phosphate adenylyltransferase